MRKVRKALAALLLAGIICMTAPASAATMHREVDDPAIEMTAELGYQNRITYGKAMPLRVRIRNNGGADLEGKLGMNAYVNTREYNRYETVISVPSGAEKEYLLPVSVMTKQDVFTPEITVGGKVVEAVNLKAGGLINPSAMLIGVLSTRPQALANLTVNQDNDTEYLGEYSQVIPLDLNTFPDNGAMLEAFAMLVIDDIDPAALTGKQQEALAGWLGGRHVLLCGSGMSQVAYFADRTGLQTAGAVTSGSVLPKLEELANARTSGNQPQIALAKLTGAEPFARDEDGNGLIFRTETGNSRIYTTAFEMGETLLNKQEIMHYFWRKVLVSYDSSLYYSLFYPSSYASAPVVYPGDSMSVPVRSPMPAAVLIAAAALAAGCVIWILLKRKDKQTWMWLALPVLAAAAAAVILVISGSSELNKPKITYMENLLQDPDGSTTRYIGIDAAASAAGLHSYELEGAPITVQYNQDVWYYEDEERENAEPVEMVMCYTTGGQERISLLTNQPWEMCGMLSQSTLNGIGRAKAEIWMENDGLHGTIQNDTTLSLKAGKVITGYGFADVPALKPGGSASFMLKEVPYNPNSTAPKSGEMCRNAGYSLYSISYAAYGVSEYATQYSSQSDIRQSLVSSVLDKLSGGDYYSGSTAGVFLYAAEAEESLPLKFRVDGKAVDNAAGRSMLNVEMRYLPVGKTGVMYRMPGMDQAVKMLLDDDDMPSEESPRDPKDSYYNNYHSLSERPAFRFSPDARNMEITAMSIVLPTYVQRVRCFLLNAKTGEWDEVGINTDVKDPGNYLNAEGQLFCRFEPDSYDSDMDIPTPALSLEGRTQHAEN